VDVSFAVANMIGEAAGDGGACVEENNSFLSDSEFK